MHYYYFQVNGNTVYFSVQSNDDSRPGGWPICECAKEPDAKRIVDALNFEHQAMRMLREVGKAK